MKKYIVFLSIIITLNEIPVFAIAYGKTKNCFKYPQHAYYESVEMIIYWLFSISKTFTHRRFNLKKSKLAYKSSEVKNNNKIHYK